MNARDLKLEVGVALNVDKKTAETCLKIVEAYLNAHRDIKIWIEEDYDGTESFKFVNNAERTTWKCGGNE